MTTPFFIIKSLSWHKTQAKKTHKTQNTLALKTLLRTQNPSEKKKKRLQSPPQGSPALEAMGKVPLLRNYLGKVYPVGNAYMGPTKRDKGIHLQQCIGDIISSGEGTPQKEFKSCKFSGVYTIHPWKRKIIFQAIIFRFYANLRGCIAWNLLSTSMT